MDCKFLSNGIALQYHNFLTPCCIWRADTNWINSHKVEDIDIVHWHQSKELINAKAQLSQGQWPIYCLDCKNVETQGRQDSVRLNGASAYGEYKESDLTLEIRPGNVCNFACQTCWPFASTRVETYYKKAGIPNPLADAEQNNFADFKFINPIAHRLKSIVVLGGEPFYDPKCIEFLHWAKTHTSADLLAFTNGSVVDLDLINALNRKVTLVFSLDAAGHPAEYIRFGTDWDTVWGNYQRTKLISNVNVRVNITTSPYNYIYIPELLELLIEDWPEVVSFGTPVEEFFCEQIVPPTLRTMIISKLETTIYKLQQANIEAGQKANAVNAIQSIVSNLKTANYNQELHQKFINFVNKMDSVKNIKFSDYCVENIKLLSIEAS